MLVDEPAVFETDADDALNVDPGLVAERVALGEGRMRRSESKV